MPQVYIRSYNIYVKIYYLLAYLFLRYSIFEIMIEFDTPNNMNNIELRSRGWTEERSEFHSSIINSLRLW